MIAFSSLTSSYQPFQPSEKEPDPGQPRLTQPSRSPDSCKRKIRRWTDPGRCPSRGRVKRPEQCLTHVQCPAKKFDFKLTKCTVTDLFFRLKYLVYSDHSTFYSNVLNFLWRLQTSFDISLVIRRQTSQLSIAIDKSIRKKQLTFKDFSM